MRRRLLIPTLIVASVIALHGQQPAPSQRPFDILTEIRTLLTELETYLAPVPPPPPLPPSSVKVATAAELQAALNSGLPIVELTPGDYVGNFVIPRSVTLVGLPAGIITGRVTTPDPAVPGSELPRPELAQYRLIAADKLRPVLTVPATGVTDVTVRGITLTGVAGDRTMVLVGTNQVTDVNLTPQRITLDQLAVVATGGRGHRGIELHTRDFTVTNSYIGEFLEQYRQSQGIYFLNGPGPGLIENNFVAGSGENIMFGGDDPKIVGVLPTDITVRGNTLFKPQAWRSSPGSVANIFEVKSGVRITLENNVLDGNWKDIQAGHSIVLTVRNQYGKATWNQVDDIRVLRNVMRNTYESGSFAVNILGNDNNHPSQQTQRITIEGNLFADAKSGVQVSRGVCQMLTLRNNTMPKIAGRFVYYVALDSSGAPLGCVSPSTIERNVFTSGAYGIFGEGPVQPGTTTLTFWTGGNYAITGNLIEKSAARSIPYPAGNTLVAPGTLLGLLDAATFKYLTDPTVGF